MRALPTWINRLDDPSGSWVASVEVNVGSATRDHLSVSSILVAAASVRIGRRWQLKPTDDLNCKLPATHLTLLAPRTHEALDAVTGFLIPPKFSLLRISLMGRVRLGPNSVFGRQFVGESDHLFGPRPDVVWAWVTLLGPVLLPWTKAVVRFAPSLKGLANLLLRIPPLPWGTIRWKGNSSVYLGNATLTDQGCPLVDGQVLDLTTRDRQFDLDLIVHLAEPTRGLTPGSTTQKFSAAVPESRRFSDRGL